MTTPEKISSGSTGADYAYTVYFEPAEEGGFNVVVPGIPEICTCGDTIAEARAMATDAIRCVIESALVHGEPIPTDLDETAQKERVTVPATTLRV